MKGVRPLTLTKKTDFSTKVQLLETDDGEYQVCFFVYPLSENTANTLDFHKNQKEFDRIDKWLVDNNIEFSKRSFIGLDERRFNDSECLYYFIILENESDFVFCKLALPNIVESFDHGPINRISSLTGINYIDDNKCKSHTTQ